MSLGIANRPATRPFGGAAWRRALTTALHCVLALLGIAIVVQTLVVVEARPQDLITGVHGMADLIWRAVPPDFSKLPSAAWPTLQTVDIALFGTMVGVIIAVPLALLAAAVVAVWLDGRNSRRQLRTEVAMRLSALDAADQTTRASLKDAQEGLREAQAKLTLLESRLAESQNQQAALEALYRELAPSRDEWALTEIEQVLQLASQQIQLARSVPSALVPAWPQAPKPTTESSKITGRAHVRLMASPSRERTAERAVPTVAWARTVPYSQHASVSWQNAASGVE